MVERIRVKNKGGGSKKNVSKALTPANMMLTSRAIREWAITTGELPHMILLRAARGERINGHKPTYEEQIDAANKAAPFFAPKLASIAVTEDDNRPTKQFVFNEAVLEGLSSDELTIFRKVFTTIVSGGPGREDTSAGDTKPDKVYSRTIDLEAE